jgi:hypothetical protein
METIYKGHRFRSQLEARWAVFLDELGIKYEYIINEKADFWLPQVKMWAKVKSEDLSIDERLKTSELSRLSGHPVLLLVGAPEDKPYFAIEPDEQVDGEYCLTMYHNYPLEEGRFYSNPGGEEDSHFEDTAEAAKAARSARLDHVLFWEVDQDTFQFPLGEIVVTPAALDAFIEACDNIEPYLIRHATGDWGDLDEHDKAENEKAIKGWRTLRGRDFVHAYGRIFSVYKIQGGNEIWIITEADRSETSVCLPDEW